MNITGLNLHKGQSRIKDEILNSPEIKFHILNASRQAGKTSLLEQLALYYALNNKKVNILWVAPVFSITKKTFISILNNLISSGIIKEFSKSDQTITFTNDSQISFRSAQNYDNIRGGSYHYCFIDEFAYIDPEAWNSVIRQTLAVKGIKAFISSTPKGKNLFFELAKRGQIDEFPKYSYHYMNYTENPFYDLQEIEDAKKTLPEKIFKQEYEAEFIDDGGSVFSNISEQAIITKFKDPVSTERYYAGLDIGKQVDYTVLTIMNQKNEVVFIYRDQNKPWNILVKNIVHHLKRYKALCLIEINSIGDPIFEQIKKEYHNIKPFYTSSSSKKDLIENLIYAFNINDIFIPTKELFPALYKELELFSFEYNKNTRTISYGAPLGFHDDLVISLGLCREAKNSIKQITTKFL